MPYLKVAEGWGDGSGTLGQGKRLTLTVVCGPLDQASLRVRGLQMAVTLATEADMIWRSQVGSLRSRSDG